VEATIEAAGQAAADTAGDMAQDLGIGDIIDHAASTISALNDDVATGIDSVMEPSREMTAFTAGLAQDAVENTLSGDAVGLAEDAEWAVYGTALYEPYAVEATIEAAGQAAADIAGDVVQADVQQLTDEVETVQEAAADATTATNEAVAGLTEAANDVAEGIGDVAEEFGF
jgi:hypothetical protein